MKLETFNPQFAKFNALLNDAVNGRRFRVGRVMRYLNSLDLTKIGTHLDQGYVSITLQFPETIRNYLNNSDDTYGYAVGRLLSGVCDADCGAFICYGLSQEPLKGPEQVLLLQLVREKPVRRRAAVELLKSLKPLIDFLEGLRYVNGWLPGLFPGPLSNKEKENEPKRYRVLSLPPGASGGEFDYFMSTDDFDEARAMYLKLLSFKEFRGTVLLDKEAGWAPVVTPEFMKEMAVKGAKEGGFDDADMAECRLNDLGITGVFTSINGVFRDYRTDLLSIAGDESILVIKSGEGDTILGAGQVLVLNFKDISFEWMIYALPIALRRHLQKNPKINKIVFSSSTNKAAVNFLAAWICNLSGVNHKTILSGLPEERPAFITTENGTTLNRSMNIDMVIYGQGRDMTRIANDMAKVEVSLNLAN